MRGLVEMLDRALRPIEFAAVVCAGAMMVLAMVLTSLDAILRYAFSAPISWQYQLTSSYLLVGMICLALAWTYRRGGYVRVDFLIASLPRPLGHGLLRLASLLSAAYIGLLTWTAGVRFWSAYSTNEILFGDINWPVAWSWVWIPIGCGLLTIRLLLIAVGPAAGLELADRPEDGTS